MSRCAVPFGLESAYLCTVTGRSDGTDVGSAPMATHDVVVAVYLQPIRPTSAINGGADAVPTMAVCPSSGVVSPSPPNLFFDFDVVEAADCPGAVPAEVRPGFHRGVVNFCRSVNPIRECCRLGRRRYYHTSCAQGNGHSKAGESLDESPRLLLGQRWTSSRA